MPRRKKRRRKVSFEEIRAEYERALEESDMPRPKALDPEYRRGAKKMHQKQEKRVAKKLRGEEQRGSGNQPFKRGDVKACEENVQVELLVECKTTEARSIRVEAKWLEKITREALEAGKEPALSIEIQQVKPGTPRDWTMVPTEVLNNLLDKK